MKQIAGSGNGGGGAGVASLAAYPTKNEERRVFHKAVPAFGGARGISDDARVFLLISSRGNKPTGVC